ncbi:hypothetical protein HFN89_00420 [Rhizobium laguerreae]|nr:hypothetical protein [Rhizobium laguerreae]
MIVPSPSATRRNPTSFFHILIAAIRQRREARIRDALSIDIRKDIGWRV